MKARLHLYSHAGPKTRAYIIADPAALRELARVLQTAANGSLGFETAEFYGSDGHPYELFVTCDVSEEEWQDIPLPSDKKSDPAQSAVVKSYDEMMETISPKR